MVATPLLHQCHCLPLHLFSSPCLLRSPCCLPPHRKIHHPRGTNIFFNQIKNLSLLFHSLWFLAAEHEQFEQINHHAEKLFFSERKLLNTIFFTYKLPFSYLSHLIVRLLGFGCANRFTLTTNEQLEKLFVVMLDFHVWVRVSLCQFMFVRKHTNQRSNFPNSWGESQ